MAGILGELPTQVLDATALLLEPADRRHLAGTCRLLRQASAAWFPEVNIKLQAGETDVELLASWMHRCQARAHITVLDMTNMAVLNMAVLRALHGSADCIRSLSFARDRDRCTESGHIVVGGAILIEDVAPLTALTSLERKDWSCFKGSVEQLWRLKQLQRLDVNWNRGDIVGSWRGATALTLLTRLSLSCAFLEQQAGDLFGSLAALTGLQDLEFSFCDLDEVPEAVSSLVHLTRLSFPGSDFENGDWQQLAPLKQLRALELWSVHMFVEIPAVISELTALTKLMLPYGNHQPVTGGFQHLAPLTRLELLSLPFVEEVPAAITALQQLSYINFTSILPVDGLRQLLQLPRLKILCVDVEHDDNDDKVVVQLQERGVEVRKRIIL